MEEAVGSPNGSADFWHQNRGRGESSVPAPNLSAGPNPTSPQATMTARSAHE